MSLDIDHIDRYADMPMFGRDETLNRFSNWFDAINKDSTQETGLKIPRTEVFRVPIEVRIAVSEPSEEENIEIIKKWIDEEVTPILKQAGLYNRLLFVKNGVYSHKFAANKGCLTDGTGLLDSFITIAQEALCRLCGYDGNDELVVRERIMCDRSSVATIYHGLPFLPEFRVFYDFDLHEPIFIVNYWDMEEARENIVDCTDKIVFKSQGPVIQAVFEKYKGEVQDMVTRAMSHVTELSGPWSIDIMKVGSNFYLIDMALAEQSAYWDRRPGAIKM